METQDTTNGTSSSAFANEGLMPEAHLLHVLKMQVVRSRATHKNSQRQVIDKSVARMK